MNNTYIIEGDGIKDVLDSTEEVMEMITKFKELYPDFKYDMVLNHDKNSLKWIVKLNISNEKFKIGLSGEGV